ncbi:hypothetical protein STEG23_011716, partial [Scotinomys teguina]
KLSSGLLVIRESKSGFPKHSNHCNCPWIKFQDLEKDESLHTLQQVIDGVDVGSGQLKAMDVDLSDSYGQGLGELPGNSDSPDSGTAEAPDLVCHTLPPY